MKTPCIHFWLVDPPDGPTSPAVCKKCGAETVLMNAWGSDDKSISVTPHQEYYYTRGFVLEDK